MELNWISAKQAAEAWGISTRRVQALCANNQIKGAARLGNAWLIPKDAVKPADGRVKNGRKPANTQ